MANIGFYKILNELPSQVDKDSFYLVSDSDRFDLFVTSNGVVPTAVRLANVKHLQVDVVPDPNDYYEGDEWLDVLTMTKYKLYYDGTKKIWVEVGNNPMMNPNLVYEAPIDGQQYARKDGGWVTIEVPVTQPAISTPTAWDGTLHNIDLSSNAYQTLTVNNGVTVVAIGVTFPADANEKLYEKAILIDNSNNNSAIAAITFDDNSGAYSWEWSVGDPINGIPANGKAELHLYNRSATVVKALTDTEA